MFDLENQQSRVILKPRREKSIRNRHPWIFSGAVSKVKGDPTPGDIVSVYSADDVFLAKGFYNPESQIVLRALTFANDVIDRKFLLDRLQQAARLRASLISENVDAYRLVHSDGDGLSGLVVDRYADVLSVQFNSLGMNRLKEFIVEDLVSLFSPESIIERTESHALRAEGMVPSKQVLYGSPTGQVLITENGHHFMVDIMEGQKTGFFLDQRNNRQLIGVLATGKRVLNCFSYSGGFSVYAAANAAITTSVDISEKAIALATENFQLNQIDAEAHQFIAANAFEYIRDVPGNEYDIIILDPPAFIKRKQHINRGARGYKDINRLAIEKVKAGGTILTCSCSSHVSWELFQKIIFSAATEAGRPVKIIARPGQPLDHPINVFHPEGEYLKTLLLQVD